MTRVELGLNASIHLDRQAMAVRVPEGTYMAQEACLLGDGQFRQMSGTEARRPLMMACHGVPCASAASQAIRTAAVSSDRRFDFGRPICWGTTPLAACGLGNWPRREMIVAAPENPSRRALNKTSTIVRPEPISTIVLARASCSRSIVA